MLSRCCGSAYVDFSTLDWCSRAIRGFRSQDSIRIVSGVEWLKSTRFSIRAAKGVTSWVKQGTANPNAQNGPGDVNSVWISDVVNSTNNAVIIAGSYRGDVVFDNGPSPTERNQRTAFLAQLDRYGGWSWFVENFGQPSDSVEGSAHIEPSVGPPEFGYAVGLRIPSHSAITP